MFATALRLGTQPRMVALHVRQMFCPVTKVGQRLERSLSTNDSIAAPDTPSRERQVIGMSMK